jgi:thymidylate synthase
MYKSLFECDLAIGERHDTAVVLGWYPLKKFTKEFDKSAYGVAGNLFNPTHGVELLIRNLLFNVQIKNVIICAFTKEDSANTPGLALRKAIRERYADELADIRIYFCDTPLQMHQAISQVLQTKMDLTPTRQQVIKEPIKIMDKIITGDIYSQVIKEATIELAYPEVVKQIRNHGRLIANIQEYINLNIVLTDEEIDMNRLVQSVDSNLESSLLGYIHDFLNGTQSEHSYSYGDRLLEKNQVQNIIDKLTEKPLTMAGMMSIWYPEDLIKGNSPCLTQIWVRASTDGKLDMTATFRSNDMYRAWQFNAYALRALQIQIATNLKMTPGILTTVSFSAHIYQKDFEEIQVFLDNPQAKKVSKKDESFYSCVGNFVINRRDSLIEVEHFSNEGEFINNWQLTYIHPLGIKCLMKDICTQNPSIEIDHTLYLYDELVKALSPVYRQL